MTVAKYNMVVETNEIYIFVPLCFKPQYFTTQDF
jgi:hypothetical protein